MKLTPKIEKAIRKAAFLHGGQTRKAELPIPYVTHLFSVAVILSMYTENEEVIIAGLLHDVIEDTSCSPDELEADFGSRIRDLVLEVTEEKERNGQKILWRDRKSTYLMQMRSSSEEALLIATADKIHNLQTTIDDHKRVGPTMWKNFAAPVDEQLWFFESFLEILKSRNAGPITDHYAEVIKEARPIFKSK